VKSVSAEGAAHYRGLRDNCNTFVTPMLPLPALLLRSRKSLQLRGARIVLPEDRFVNPLREKISASGSRCADLPRVKRPAPPQEGLQRQRANWRLPLVASSGGSRGGAGLWRIGRFRHP